MNGDEHEALQKIKINYKEKDVNFIHFKKIHAISPRKFNNEILEAIEEQANDKDRERNKSLMRNKINESIDNVMRIKSGVELIDIVKSIKPATNISKQTDYRSVNVSN